MSFWKVGLVLVVLFTSYCFVCKLVTFLVRNVAVSSESKRYNR